MPTVAAFIPKTIEQLGERSLSKAERTELMFDRPPGRAVAKRWFSCRCSLASKGKSKNKCF